MWETWVQYWGWEDPLEKGTVTHSNILAWRTSWTEEPGSLQVHGVAKSWTRLSAFHFLQNFLGFLIKISIFPDTVLVIKKY